MTLWINYLQIKYDALRKSDPNYKKMSTATKQAKWAEAAQTVMAPVALSVRPLHPLKVWEDISPQFLVTFWSLQMYDLYVPADSYQREINKLRQLAAQAADSKDMASFFISKITLCPLCFNFSLYFYENTLKYFKSIIFSSFSLYFVQFYKRMTKVWKRISGAYEYNIFNFY